MDLRDFFDLELKAVKEMGGGIWSHFVPSKNYTRKAETFPDDTGKYMNK